MKRLFEVPYNFDKNLIIFYKQYLPDIKCIYMPAFMEDCIDARYYINEAFEKYPKTREEYVSHIKFILQNGINITILFQDPYKNIKEETIDFYIDLGIRNFTINRDDIALYMREKYKNLNLYISASITKCLSPKDILDNEERYKILYDEIILHNPYSRALRQIKNLPVSIKYVLLIGASCSYSTDKSYCQKHWFTKIENLNCNYGDDTSILMLDKALHLFDKYISSYKIEGRCLPTESIMKKFLYYQNECFFDNENKRQCYLKQYKNFTFENTTNISEFNIYTFYNSANDIVFFK